MGRKKKKIEAKRILLLRAIHSQNLANLEFRSANQCFSSLSFTLSAKASSGKAFRFLCMDACWPLLSGCLRRGTADYDEKAGLCSNQIQISAKLTCYLWNNLQGD